eukprot:768543-Hanusia_phi.AAC.1
MIDTCFKEKEGRMRTGGAGERGRREEEREGERGQREGERGQWEGERGQREGESWGERRGRRKAEGGGEGGQREGERGDRKCVQYANYYLNFSKLLGITKESKVDFQTSQKHILEMYRSGKEIPWDVRKPQPVRDLSRGWE